MKKIIIIFLAITIFNSSTYGQIDLILNATKIIGSVANAANVEKIAGQTDCFDFISELVRLLELIECMKYEFDLNGRLASDFTCFERLNYEIANIKMQATINKIAVSGIIVGKSVASKLNILINESGKSLGHQFQSGGGGTASTDPCKELNEMINEMHETIILVRDFNSIIKNKIMKEVEIHTMRNEIHQSDMYRKRQKI